MKKEINKNMDKEKLKNYIDELREVLNEICVTDKDTEGIKKRLLVSEHLDKIIVEYMNMDNE